MRAFGLNPATGDIDRRGQKFAIIVRTAAIAQKLKLGLSLIFQEWFLDTSQGCDYFGRIFVKGATAASVQQYLTEYILSCEGIASMTSLTVSFSGPTRKMTVSFQAVTVDGDPIPFKDSFVVGSVGSSIGGV